MAQQADDVAEYGWLAPLYGEAEVEAAERTLRPSRTDGRTPRSLLLSAVA